jgi:hypothetical protein
MFHAYIERFDVIGRRGNILGWEEEVNKAININTKCTVWCKQHRAVFRWPNRGQPNHCFLL